MLKKNSKQRGFTFLETLVVISIFSLIFPMALSILFVILQQQLRIFSLSEVKRQGDYVVAYLKDNIANNAYRIYDQNGAEICEASSFNPFPHLGDVVSFRDRYDSEFSLDFNEPNLTVNYDPPLFPAPAFTFQEGQLNTSKVRIESFRMECERNSPFSAPLLKASFVACFNLNGSCASADQQKIVSLNYQTNIKLRSYPTE